MSPVENSSPEERLLTPCPPPPSVTPTARQRRRHQREKREEELIQRDRSRWDRVIVVMLLEVDGTGMKRLTLCSLLRNNVGIVKRNGVSTMNRNYEHSAEIFLSHLCNFLVQSNGITRVVQDVEKIFSY